MGEWISRELIQRQGNPQKDVVTVVYMDEAGRLREHTKLDNPHDSENKDKFHDLLRRRRPHVIVVGGQSIATATLSKRIKELLIRSLRPFQPASSEPGVLRHSCGVHVR